MQSGENTILTNGSFRLDDHWVWCGSPVVDGDKVRLYASAWSKEYPMFEGYVLHSTIVLATADEIEGKYRLEKEIFPGKHSSLQMAHNPAVRYYNGKWYMFFIASPAMDGCDVNNPDHINSVYSKIAIYLAEASAPAGPWVLREKPILESRPGKWDASIVTNPAPCILDDGRVFLYYRSNTPQGLRIGLAVAQNVDSEFERYGDEPVLSGADVEDPFVWHDGKKFGMVAKDMTGNLTGELHSGAKFVSDDGINWRCEGKAYSRTVSDRSGNVTTFGSLERPQLLFDADGNPEYLFAAVADGPGGFRKAANTWNICLDIKQK